MTPWTDPESYEPEALTWWERNRARAVVFAAIVLIGVLAFAVPESLKRPQSNVVLVETP